MYKLDNKAVGERLLQIQEALNIVSSRQFALAIDMDASYFAKVTRGEVGISNRYKAELESQFGVNITWLETGEGEMFGKTVWPGGLTEPDSANYLQKRRILKNVVNPFLVPFVDLRAQAGYTKAYDHIDYIQTLKKYPILPDVDPTGATWRYFQVAGDSMEPELQEGDTILCSLVPKDDWTQFNNLYTYVVVTESELLIKDVHRETKDYWILLSQNAHYKPKIIKVEDVKQLWVLRRHVKNRLRKNRMYDLADVRKYIKENVFNPKK